MRNREGYMAAPMYQQIADDLRRRIESHEFTVDKALPTEAALQAEYHVSRNTVRDAVNLLVQEGRLEKRQGQGTFIAPGVDRFVTRLSTDPRTSLGVASAEGYTYPALVREQERFSWTNPLEVRV